MALTARTDDGDVIERLLEAWGPIPREELERAAVSFGLDSLRIES